MKQLSGNQRFYLEHHLNVLPLARIAQRLEMPVSDLRIYIAKHPAMGEVRL